MSTMPPQETCRRNYLNRMISSRVPEELLTKLDAIAADGGITRCCLIRRMLGWYTDSLEIEERYLYPSGEDDQGHCLGGEC